MHKKRYSILKNIHHNRLVYALFIGLIGFILLYSATRYSLEPDYDELICTLLESFAEILIVTGFFIFIIEHNTIDKLITKDISVSVIKDLFRFYFKKKEMMDLMIELTQDLNQDENIPPDVIELYKRHGLLELFNEPLREGLHIKNIFVRPFDEISDLFWMGKQWSYRVNNTADSTKQKLEKKINRNGLIHQYSRDVYEGENISLENIEEYLKETLDLEFVVTEESTVSSVPNKYNDEDIKYKLLDDFNAEKGIPRGISNEVLNKMKIANRDFYVVYDIKEDESGKNRLKIGFYYDRFIQPGETIGIKLKYESLTTNFNIVSLGFSSYTMGFDFELDLGTQFVTDISQNIIGKGSNVDKSKTHLSYSGWIMPHSSFSYSWSKKENNA